MAITDELEIRVIRQKLELKKEKKKYCTLNLIVGKIKLKRERNVELREET